jgi:hypothetical protein
MLKLIYNTGVFGPIDLEYCKPVIRVGSSEDNDLVLRHPSVKPFHGLLVFRGERVLLMPPTEKLPLETDLLDLIGTEYGAGEQLLIGDLQFSLAYSSSTVALPDFLAPGGASVPASRDHAAPKATDNFPAETNPSSDGALTEQRLYCSNCQTFVPAAHVKHIGLVGQARLALCPKCSRALDADPASALEVTTPEIGGRNTQKGLGGLLKEIMKSTSRISLS